MAVGRLLFSKHFVWARAGYAARAVGLQATTVRGFGEGISQQGRDDRPRVLPASRTR
jgi:hypothetical protein